jgi:lipoprotein-releasing system permease protein
MTAVLLLAHRWLLALRRRTHVATVSAISMVAMALGAAALVVTLALLEGFQHAIRGQLERGGVHARLLPARGSELPEGEWLAALRQRHPQLEVEEIRSTAVWCMANGVALPAELEVVAGLPRVEVNPVVAARLGLSPGSEVVVASSRLVLTPLGPLPLRRRLRVDVVREGRPGEERGVVRVGEGLAQAFLDVGRGPQAVALRAREAKEAWGVASIVQEDVPEGVVVQSFQELNRPLLAALALERTMIGFAVALVMVVAALNLLCNLALVAAEKRADVALLAAMGLSGRAIFRLFVSVGAGVGVLGGVLGTAAGAVLAFLLDRTQALPLPRGVFVVSHVPFRVQGEAIAVVLAISLAAALLASLAPARAAARRDVLQGLRYE